MITSHQRVINLRPVALVTAEGKMVEQSCHGDFVVTAGDRGRGVVFGMCDVCGKPMGFKRRDPNATPPLAQVGAGEFDAGF